MYRLNDGAIYLCKGTDSIYVVRFVDNRKLVQVESVEGKYSYPIEKIHPYLVDCYDLIGYL